MLKLHEIALMRNVDLTADMKIRKLIKKYVILVLFSLEVSYNPFNLHTNVHKSTIWEDEKKRSQFSDEKIPGTFIFDRFFYNMSNIYQSHIS